MFDKILVTFVGIPGSGKTTFARNLARELDATVLASDSIRLSMWGTLENIQKTHTDPLERKNANKLVFGAMNYSAKQILDAGYSVIYDCNANHVWERNEKHDIAHETDALSVVVRIKVPYELSLERLQQREATHDARQFTREKAIEVLERFTNEIEEPTADENVIAIDGSISFDEQYKSFQSQLSVIKQRV